MIMVSKSGNKVDTLGQFLVVTGEDWNKKQTLRQKSAQNREINVGYN